MEKQIKVPDSMAEQLREFLAEEKIDLEVIGRCCDVEVVVCEESLESDLATIYSGGWIACETARDLAKKLAISIRQMGGLLDQLNVKIRKCSLGCFQ